MGMLQVLKPPKGPSLIKLMLHRLHDTSKKLESLSLNGFALLQL
jgi:hypothetical protein